MDYMKADTFKAAVKGNTEVLNEEDESQLLKTPDVGNTILHIAVQYGHLEFIDKAICIFPDLLQQKNNKENTPLHEAAALATKKTVKHLLSHLRHHQSGSSSYSCLTEVNKDGDTPFHVALRSANLEAAEVLFPYVVDHHPDILIHKTTFHRGLETPLHLFVRCCTRRIHPRGIEIDENYNKVIESNFVSQLIEASYSAMFQHDSEGFNPLMRAAQYGRVLVILGMLLSYPQLLECRDSKDMSFLHHLRLRMTDLNARDREYTLFVCEKILEMDGVDILSTSRDLHGNTPVHLAILDRDCDLAQLILDRYVARKSSARKDLIMNIKNFEGKTIFDLNTSEPNIPQTLKNLMEQLVQATRRGLQQKKDAFDKLHRAARDLDRDVFSHTDDNDNDGEDYFLSQDVMGKNILHLATEHWVQQKPSDCWSYTFHTMVKYRAFVSEAIRRFPRLMYQRDCNGDTPLHIVPLFESSWPLLETCIDYWYLRWNLFDKRLDVEVPPWKLKNSRGLLPLHEVACIPNFWGLVDFRLLLKRKSHSDWKEALSDLNHNGETALHLYARYGDAVDPEFIEDNETAVYMHDVDGLTPSLRAAKCGNILLATEIAEVHPESIYGSDYKGRNLLHYICLSISGLDDRVMYHLQRLISKEKEPLDGLIYRQDDDGNTPVHLALMNHNFEVAHYLLSQLVELHSVVAMRILVDEKKNKDGTSIMNLVKRGIDIPAKLKELLEQDSHQDPPPPMTEKVYEAVRQGNAEMLDGEDYYSRGPDGSNVIHLILRFHQIHLIENCNVFMLLDLLSDKDSKGDTPVHLAAGLPPAEALQFYKSCFYPTTMPMVIDSKGNTLMPGMVRNSKGNTFLHEAARLGNYDILFSELLDYDGIDIEAVNDNGETVLHVIARYATNTAKNFLERWYEKMQPVVYIKDFEGFTPALRAVQYGRLGVARLLIQQCPHLIEIPDNKGRTVLHHLKASAVDLVHDVKDILPVWNDFYQHCHLDDLRIAQNEDGNTALHVAISDGDFDKVKFLMEKCVQSENKRELGIVNNEGHTVFDLVSLQAHVPARVLGNVTNQTTLREDYNNKKKLQTLVSRSYINERELVDNMMEDHLYKAAIDGNSQIFEPNANDGTVNDEESRLPIRTDDFFCRQTPGGSSIIHIALQHGKANVEQFIKTALRDYPVLSLQPDSNGDTPLHLAAKWETDVALVELLIRRSERFLGKLPESQKAFHVAPWAVRNYKGSFPIHEALQTGNLQAAKALLGCDADAASRVNDLGDTPLHSFAKNGFSISGSSADEFVNTLLKKSNKAAYMRDNEGLTPLLSAARSGRLQVAQAILKYCPQSAYLRDPYGKTLLHLLRFTGEDVDESLAGSFKNTGKRLLESPEADAQRLVQDYEGNTALHHAIKTGNSVAAIVLTYRCLDDKEQRELGLVNKEGHTIPDLLASHDVPIEIIELIQKKVPKAVYLARSSYGIRKSEMKESANALSVVAALLATMAFTAAFQLPGGNNDDGFPILLSNVTFAIFSMPNTIAMCSSMLCLFLLLWVMGIGKIHGSLKLLDISIILLRVSFYLTLLTYTTGVFVVTAEQRLWMGIFVCVLSFLTFLLTFKISIKTLAKAYTSSKNFIQSVYTSTKNFIRFVKSKCKPASPTEMSNARVTQTTEERDQQNIVLTGAA